MTNTTLSDADVHVIKYFFPYRKTPWHVKAFTIYTDGEKEVMKGRSLLVV